MANLSGFVGPGMMGWLLQNTGSYRAGLWMCMGVPVVAALSMQLLAGSVQRKGG
jgi:nitrate/nitrite transporter NarK